MMKGFFHESQVFTQAMYNFRLRGAGGRAQIIPAS
jgi:hypothetical protein